MPEYKVSVKISRAGHSLDNDRAIKVFARDEQQAKEKAVEMVMDWDGVTDVEAEDCEIIHAWDR